MEGRVSCGSTSAAQVTDTKEIVASICDVLQVPPEIRERHFGRLASLVESGRPDSLVSTVTNTSSGTRSSRDTQSSFNSSQWSWISDASSAVPQSGRRTSGMEDTGAIDPASKYNQNIGNPTSGDWSIVGSTTTLSSAGDAVVSQPNQSRCRRCCWCQQEFTRPHDFRKHVDKYCCGWRAFVCRNCRAVMSQEGKANIHAKESVDFRCRHSGWAKIELQCKRRHFGCGYCSRYFDHLDNFIEHFGQSCRPDKVVGKWHLSRQIRALLQQPSLLPVVEELGLQLRGSTAAYQALWWTWKRYRLERIIRKLEYGPKHTVNESNPGLRLPDVRDFVRDLIQPSAGSVLAAEFLLQHGAPAETAASAQKDLPPLPPPSQLLEPLMPMPDGDVLYPPRQTFEQACDAVPTDPRSYQPKYDTQPLAVDSHSMCRPTDSYDPPLRPVFGIEELDSSQYGWIPGCPEMSTNMETSVEGGWASGDMCLDDLDFVGVDSYGER